MRQREQYIAQVRDLTEQWAHTEKVYERHMSTITVLFLLFVSLVLSCLLSP